jgi:hypothetical protein
LIILIDKFDSGDADSVVPLTGTRYSIDALYLPTVTNWYPWYQEEEVSLQQYYSHTDGFIPFSVFCSCTQHSLILLFYLRLVVGAKCIKV